MPRSTRNRGVALSVKEVRKVAEGLRESDRRRSDHHQQNDVPSAPRKSKISNNSIKLPEKYEMLADFFNSLGSSIRLLRLKGLMSTFTNICPKIESLTDRRFTHGHLAQLKFILPEVIVIKKVLVHDEQTSCMKPDLHVTLEANAIESEGKEKLGSADLHMRKVFRARILDFVKAHPEGGEIPEETLPEPFNQSKPDLHSYTVKASNLTLSSETSSEALLEQQPAIASHLPPTFRRRFSQKSSSFEAGNAHEKTSKDSFHSLPLPEPCLNKSSYKETDPCAISPPTKFSSKPTITETCVAFKASPCHLLPADLPATPGKDINSSTNEILSPMKIYKEIVPCSISSPTKFSSKPSHLLLSDLPATPSKDVNFSTNEILSPMKIALEGTPAKLVSTPAKLMSVTPALKPPKRLSMSSDDDSNKSTNKLVRRTPRTRSLKFDSPLKNAKLTHVVKEAGKRGSLKFDSPVKDAKCESKVKETGCSSIKSDILDILPESLLQSIKEKEKKALEEQDPAISQAKRRVKIIASLPKLFDMIHLLFQSIKRSVITKEELMHKIIAGHSDIVDRREVEEQLNLLQELVPEWISEKLASSGDCLLCINKTWSPQLIRARLAEAK